MAARTLSQGESIKVIDYRCKAGPADEPFPELHLGFSASYVRKGSFGYRTRGKSFELVAGSILVGHPGDEYMCTHHHAVGFVRTFHPRRRSLTGQVPPGSERRSQDSPRAACRRRCRMTSSKGRSSCTTTSA